MAHLKHATVMGINEAAVRRGLLSWDTEKRAQQACYVVSKKLGGNEQVSSVSPKTAALIFNELKAINNAAIKGGMKVAAAGVTSKTASARPIFDVMVKAACLAVETKLAESDGSLTNNEPNTPESAALTNAVAALDNANRAPGQYLLGVGNSDMVDGGVVGEEMPHPMQQQAGEQVENSVTQQSKVSSQLRARGITGQKLSHALKHGTPEQKKQASVLVAALRKEAAATRKNPIDAAIASVLGKTAEDMDGMGGLFGGGDPTNAGEDVSPDAIVGALLDAGIDPSDVTADDVLQALDASPDGGDAGGGSDGDSDTPPDSDKGDKPEPKKNDSDEEKDAAFIERLMKQAEGGSLAGNAPNTPESAASTNEVAALDQKNRKTDEYLIGQGGSSPIGSDGAGQQYDVQKAPKAPAENPDNLVTDETKTAEEREYRENMRKLAATYGPKLPASMPKAQKIAHIKSLAALSPGQRGEYMKKLTPKR